MWILQENEAGMEFWDTYMHDECMYIEQQETNPFKEI